MVGASVRPRRSRPYLNTLHHDFVLNDVGTVTGHPYVMEGWRGIPKIFQVGLWQFDNVNMACSFRELFLFGVAFEGDGNDRGDPHAAHALFCKSRFVERVSQEIDSFFDVGAALPTSEVRHAWNTFGHAASRSGELSLCGSEREMAIHVFDFPVVPQVGVVSTSALL